MSTKYSDLLLEQYVLNELNGELHKQLAAAIETDAHLRQRVKAIRDSSDQIDTQYDHQDILRDIQLRIKNKQINQHVQNAHIHPRGLWPRLAVALPVVAIVAITSLLIKENISTPLEQVLPISEDGVRIKGMTPHINIYQKSQNGITLLNEHAEVKKSDILQLAYIAAGRQYGMIFSIDGNGVVTLHYPYDQNTNPRLQTSGEIALERSYELDDAPRFEQFYFITAEQAFSVAAVLEIAQNFAASHHDRDQQISGLPDYLHQSQRTLIKANQQ